MKFKLGPKVNYFTDIYSGITIYRDEVKEFPHITPRMRDMIIAKHLIMVEDEPKPEKPLPDLGKSEVVTYPEPETVKEPEMDYLYSLTVKAIMAKYDFLTEEHLAIAKAQRSKTKLIKFLREIEKEYE